MATHDAPTRARLDRMRLGDGEPAFGPWEIAPLTELARIVTNAAGVRPGRPSVVAIDGRGGSGKTTCATAMERLLPRATTVHADDVAPWGSADWDDELVGGVLTPLHRGESVALRPRAWSTGHRSRRLEVPADDWLVIVEGIGAARRDVMPFVDAVVWVQADLDVIDRRRARRATPADAGALADEAGFLAGERPWERACVVVNGSPGSTLHADAHVLLAPAHGRPGGRTREGEGMHDREQGAWHG